MSLFYCFPTCRRLQYTKANAGNWINRLMVFEGKQAVGIKPDMERRPILQQPACSHIHRWNCICLLTAEVHLSTKAPLWRCHGSEHRQRRFLCLLNVKMKSNRVCFQNSGLHTNWSESFSVFTWVDVMNFTFIMLIQHWLSSKWTWT